MNVGGVEKAMLGLLSVLPFDKYEVHLGLLHKKGGFLNALPQQIIIHEISCYDKYWEIINEPPLYYIRKMISGGQFLDALIHLLLYIHFKVSSNRYWFYRYLMRKEPKFPLSFDMAVSFAGPSQMMDYYVCKQVEARVKCGWIHFDVSKFGIDKGMTKMLYQEYERIFIVSETGKQIFDSMFPQFKNKTEVFYNIVSSTQVRELADIGETFDDDFEGTRILTVGRISQEKGQRNAIRALKLLVDKEFNVRWYFVGDGKDIANLKNDIEDFGLTKHVVFLGTKTNPYGYMRDCDVYVQPSRHEGFCITLAEALCFGSPILATDFTGAKEQLKKRENGIVVGMTEEEMARGIEKAMRFPKINVSCSKDTSRAQLEQLLRWLD